MAKLTREEVIARVKAGKSLAGKNLSGLDLSGVNLSGVNLSRADLRSADLLGTDLCRANLSGAYLTMTNLSEAKLRGATLFLTYLLSTKLEGANLRESIIDSAIFENADLSGADLTGANIWNIATADWKIDGVKCEYAYNSKYPEGKDKTRRDFKPGEFEQIYKSFTKLELIFKEGFSLPDYSALLAVIDRINHELPTANLNLRKMERVGNTTTTTLAAENKEAIEEIVKNSLQKHYSKIHDELKAIKGIPALQNISSQLPQPVSDMLQPQLKEIIEQSSDRLLNLNITYVVGNEIRGQLLTGNNPVAIQHHTQIVNNFLDSLESSSFDDPELSGTYKELQDHYDKLDEQGKEDLLKFIAEEANKNSGIMEKLKEYGKWGAKEGWDIGKAVITNILTECAKGRI